MESKPLCPIPGPVLETHRDSRGVLRPVDFGVLPFVPCRFFIIDEVPPGQVRGGHGHRRGHQLLCALAGCVEVEFRPLKNRDRIFVLEPGGPTLQVPPGVVTWQRFVAPGSRLLVLASDPYDPDNYIHADPHGSGS